METTTKEKALLSTSQQWAGIGTNLDPYQITSVNDLKSLAQYVNTGNSTKNLYFIIKKDIDMSGVSDFIPIGGWNVDGNSCNSKNYFQGKLDGNAKVISNLSILKDISNSGNIRVGLFGYLVGDTNNRAEIRNLRIRNSNLSGNNYVGALCGQLSFALIENVNATGKVNAAQVSGGLFGINDNSIIKNAYTDSDVSGGNFLGSFCGENGKGSSISNCYSKGSSEGNDNIGGFCGINGGSITESYFIGSVVAANDYVGGFCGKNSQGSINKCYVGEIRIIGHFYVGGFCGENYNAKIDNSYACAEIHSDDYSGGFCGKNDYMNTVIQNSYSAGSIATTTTSGKVDGGFLGIKSNMATLNNCFRSKSLCSHNSYGTAISESDMKGAAFVKSLNNKQTPSPWKIDYSSPDAANNGLPILDFQEPIIPPAYIEVTTTLESGPHPKGSKSMPAKVIGSYIEHYSAVKSKGFYKKQSSSTEWTSIPVDGTDFVCNISITRTYYDYKAYVTNENGDIFFGNIITVGTAY